MLPDSRECRKCGTDKPLSEFSKAPRGKYGRKASCKSCDAARHAANHLPKQRTPLRSPRDPSESKQCNRCGSTKTLREFSLARKATESTNAVYRSHCKGCQAEQARKWYTDNPERANENRRRFNLASNYGLSVADYNNMLQQQNGTCAVCGKGEPAAHGRTGRRFRLSVDHCHDTGTIRGLLCQKCNRAIGLFDDNPILMRKAISYLLRPRKGTAQ